MGHLVGFPVTFGGFKVDGEGEDGLFRHSHQTGALLFGLLAAGVQLPAVGVIGNGGPLQRTARSIREQDRHRVHYENRISVQMRQQISFQIPLKPLHSRSA